LCRFSVWETGCEDISKDEASERRDGIDLRGSVMVFMKSEKKKRGKGCSGKDSAE
jgi:hypothetical protein